jgi:hypothetical protein
MSLTEISYYLALLIGVTTLIIGICAMIRPLPMAVKFGVSVGESAVPYVLSTGVRDVFMGLTVLILWSLQHWKALGAISLCLGLVAISDFQVVRKYGDKKTSYVHLAGAMAVFIYGAWLLAS